MREGGVAALAFPFPAPDREQVLAVLAIHRKGNGRDKGAGIVVAG